jgi:hypothetical protein
LRLVAVAGSQAEDGVEFCSYCGRIDPDSDRVCSHCGLGVRLRATGDVSVGPGTAFLIVRRDGRVSAASAAAEQLLGPHLVGRRLSRIDLRGRRPRYASCGDPPATLVVLSAA